MPTPARRATSSSGAPAPRSTTTSRAAASSCSWLRRASARSGRPPPGSPTAPTSEKAEELPPQTLRRIRPSGSLTGGNPSVYVGATCRPPTEGSSRMDDVRKVQDRFDRAELTADREALRELLADDFLSIGPRGFVLDKDQWIDRHGEFRYQSLETSEMDVRQYGDTAVVRDVQRNRATYRDQQVAVTTRVSQVWVRRDDRWRLVAIQFSPLAEESIRP